MQYRDFGRTGLRFSVLGFGCGAVGGLMVRGSESEQERTVARALDAGINYFDTAVQYGDGQSETNLGRVLRVLKPGAVHVGTKVRLRPPDYHRIPETITASIEGSLNRLRRDHVDLFHLHNPITVKGDGLTLTRRQVEDEVIPTFERLKAEGKIRHLGLTAVGDTPEVRAILKTGKFGSAQTVFNMLNPSAAEALPPHYPAQDYGRLLDDMAALGVGAIAIRVVAGGALSGSAERTGVSSAAPAPLGSALTFEADVQRAQRLEPLVHEGFAENLIEAATRYALSPAAIGTILVGMATPEQFDDSLKAIEKGPLSQAALERLTQLRSTFTGEAR